MTSENKKWHAFKTEYLHKVEKALLSVKHPRSKDILEDVRSHLDRRFAELEPDQQTRASSLVVQKKNGAHGGSNTCRKRKNSRKNPALLKNLERPNKKKRQRAAAELTHDL
ncbi:hypothetical protein ES703_117316 [subsurface metagenome]